MNELQSAVLNLKREPSGSFESRTNTPSRSVATSTHVELPQAFDLRHTKALLFSAIGSASFKPQDVNSQHT